MPRRIPEHVGERGGRGAARRDGKRGDLQATDFTARIPDIRQERSDRLIGMAARLLGHRACRAAIAVPEDVASAEDVVAAVAEHLVSGAPEQALASPVPEDDAEVRVQSENCVVAPNDALEGFDG